MFVLLLCFMCVNFVNIFDLVLCVIDLTETEMYISTLYYFTYISSSQWISGLKGSVTFVSERSSLRFSKLRKLHWEIWVRKNTGNLKMKSLKPLKELLYSYYSHFLKKIPNRWGTLFFNKILLENVFNKIFREKWPIMLILDIFFSQLRGMNPLLETFSDKF